MTPKEFIGSVKIESLGRKKSTSDISETLKKDYFECGIYTHRPPQLRSFPTLYTAHTLDHYIQISYPCPNR